MTSPFISIVIDNFNYARFLTQSIESALAQSYPNLEVIVVDDGSTDESREIIKSYADRILPVLQPANRGQGAAFNAGFAASRGDVVMFLDSDDWLYPETAARVAAAWRPDFSKIHFRLDLVDADGAPFDVHPPLEVRLDSGDVVPFLLKFGRYETVVTSGNAFARAALDAVFPIPEEAFRIAADGYLATVVPFHGPVGVIDEQLGAYRVHGGNAYANGRTTLIEELIVRIRKFLLHDSHKDRILRQKARIAQLHIAGTPQLLDPTHMEIRLASLRLGASDHPYPADRQGVLALRGFAASRNARLSWPRRATIAAWFLIVGFAPKPIALRAIRWKMLPASRPPSVNRKMKWIRRILN